MEAEVRFSLQIHETSVYPVHLDYKIPPPLTPDLCKLLGVDPDSWDEYEEAIITIPLVAWILDVNTGLPLASLTPSM
jgi:hypothetical protein